MKTNFVGTLVRRQYKAGQPYVQLVFESSGRTLLALSRNVALVRSLKLGSEYRVGGAERSVSGRSYLLEPQLIPISAKARNSRRVRYAAWAAAGCLLLVGGGIVAGLSLHDNSSQASTTPRQTTTTTQKSVTVTAEPEKTTPASTTDSTTSTPATTTTKSATSTKQKSPNPPQPSPVATSDPANPVVVPPVVEDCGSIAVAYKKVVVTDDSQPEGVTPGQDGQNKVCYPNGRDAEPVITVVTVPVDEITIVHTTPAP